MSVLGVKSALLIDNRVFPQILNENIQYDVLKGNEDVTMDVFDTQTVSDSIITFSRNAPSLQAFLDKKVFMRLKARLTINKSGNTRTVTGITGSPGNFPTDKIAMSKFLNGVVALRGFAPLQGACNCTLKINNTQFSYSPYLYQNAIFPHYGPYQEGANLQIGGLDYPDQSWDYNDFQGARNPLSVYGDNAWGESGRGSAFDEITVVTNSTSQLVVDFLWTERLYLPPFTSFDSMADKQGLSGISQIEFTFAINNINRLFSINTSAIVDPAGTPGTPAYVSSSVSIANCASYGNPTLSLIWINNTLSNKEYVALNKYPVNLYNSNVTTGTQAVLPGATVNGISTNTIQVNSIPSDIYLIIQETQSSKSIATSDAFARINNISLSFGQKTGLLSTSTNKTLYQMCVRNGCKISDTAFNYILGSPLRINLQKDVSLGSQYAVGSKGMFNIQFTVNYTNISNRSVTFDMVIVTVNEGILELQNGNGVIYQGLVDDAIISNSNLMQPINAELDQIALQGGASLSECTRMFAKKALPYVKEAAHFLPGGNYLYKAAQLGEKGLDLYHQYTGQGLSPKLSYQEALKMVGSGLVGGKVIKNKAKLRSAMRQY